MLVKNMQAFYYWFVLYLSYASCYPLIIFLLGDTSDSSRTEATRTSIAFYIFLFILSFSIYILFKIFTIKGEITFKLDKKWISTIIINILVLLVSVTVYGIIGPIANEVSHILGIIIVWIFFLHPIYLSIISLKMLGISITIDKILLRSILYYLTIIIFFFFSWKFGFS